MSTKSTTASSRKKRYQSDAYSDYAYRCVLPKKLKRYDTFRYWERSICTMPSLNNDKAFHRGTYKVRKYYQRLQFWSSPGHNSDWLSKKWSANRLSFKIWEKRLKSEQKNWKHNAATGKALLHFECWIGLMYFKGIIWYYLAYQSESSDDLSTTIWAAFHTAECSTDCKTLCWREH